MKKNNLIGIAIIVLLLIFGFLLLRSDFSKNLTQSNTTVTPKPTPVYKQEVWTIMINQKGFSPQAMNVPFNSKVNFVNLSAQVISVQFTKAPDFANGLTFDIGLGQSFTLHATASGSFTFVNKNNSSQQGSFFVQ